MATTDIDVHVGKRIRWRRRQLGLTQSDLGLKTGVRFQQVQKWECGGTSLRPDRLYRLATLLQVDINYFFEGFKPPNQTPANDPSNKISDETSSGLRAA